VRRLQLDRETDGDFLKTIPWLCSQCSRCEEICTEELSLPDLILALRKLALERGVAPETVRTVAATVRETGSPYQSLTRSKSSWQESAKLTSDSEVLCWMGCTASIMSPNIAQTTAKVLDELGGGFRALTDEPCCGEPLVALGMIDEAKEVAAKAVEAIQTAAASGVSKLVTSCAGCYHTFTHSYPEKLGIEIADVEILHLSQLLGSSIEESNLQLQSPMKVTYHDPCSLGRGSQVYDPPRQVLQSIGGLELEEMDPTREKTLCCGGGGGVWSLDRRMAMEIASRKLAVSTGGVDLQAVVTTCPMCYNNFRYTLKKDKSPLRVYELSQIVAMGLG
jgi:Fe-S oxidoreductase